MPFLSLPLSYGSDGICFADFDGYLQGIMDRLRKENGKKTPEAMLYRLFQILVENDIHVLDVIYKQLATLEEEIPKDNARFFLQKMYTMKHSIYQLFRYYQQLTELADDLMEWDWRLFRSGRNGVLFTLHHKDKTAGR